MKNTLLHVSLCLFLNLFLFSSLYANENDTSYQTRVELTGKLGYSSKKSSKRNISRLGFVVPMFQVVDSHLGYITAIGMIDSAKHLEGNLGIGYRSFINPAWILGEYVFYDLRSTENNNLLSQITIGLEAFSKNLEFRINGYIPTKKKYELENYNSYSAKYNSHTNKTQFSIKNKKVLEQGVPGFDIEIGGSHNKLPRLEIFLAYYHFAGKDLKSTIGGRLRSNLKILHWLTAESEINYDNNRKFVSYIGAKIGWSLGKNKKQNSWSHTKMTQLPVRDIDIISSELNKSESLLSKEYDQKRGFVVKELSSQDELSDEDLICNTIECLCQMIIDKEQRVSAIEVFEGNNVNGFKERPLNNEQILFIERIKDIIVEKNSSLSTELALRQSEKNIDLQKLIDEANKNKDEENQKKTKNLEKVIEELKNKLKNKKDSSDAMSDEIKNLEKELKKNKKEKQDKDDLNEKLKKDLIQKEGIIKKLETKAKEQKAAIEQDKNELQNLENKKNEIQQKHEKLKRHLQNVNKGDGNKVNIDKNDFAVNFDDSVSSMPTEKFDKQRKQIIQDAMTSAETKLRQIVNEYEKKQKELREKEEQEKKIIQKLSSTLADYGIANTELTSSLDGKGKIVASGRIEYKNVMFLQEKINKQAQTDSDNNKNLLSNYDETKLISEAEFDKREKARKLKEEQDRIDKENFIKKQLSTLTGQPLKDFKDKLKKEKDEARLNKKIKVWQGMSKLNDLSFDEAKKMYLAQQKLIDEQKKQAKQNKAKNTKNTQKKPPKPTGKTLEDPRKLGIEDLNKYEESNSISYSVMTKDGIKLTGNAFSQGQVGLLRMHRVFDNKEGNIIVEEFGYIVKKGAILSPDQKAVKKSAVKKKKKKRKAKKNNKLSSKFGGLGGLGNLGAMMNKRRNKNEDEHKKKIQQEQAKKEELSKKMLKNGKKINTNLSNAQKAQRDLLQLTQPSIASGYKRLVNPDTGKIVPVKKTTGLSILHISALDYLTNKNYSKDGVDHAFLEKHEKLGNIKRVLLRSQYYDGLAKTKQKREQFMRDISNNPFAKTFNKNGRFEFMTPDSKIYRDSKAAKEIKITDKNMTVIDKAFF